MASQAGKLRCLLHYFDTIIPRYSDVSGVHARASRPSCYGHDLSSFSLAPQQGRTDKGTVTFHRRVVPDDPHALLRELENDSTPLHVFEACLSGAIEDDPDTLQVSRTARESICAKHPFWLSVVCVHTAG